MVEIYGEFMYIYIMDIMYNGYIFVWYPLWFTIDPYESWHPVKSSKMLRSRTSKAPAREDLTLKKDPKRPAATCDPQKKLGSVDEIYTRELDGVPNQLKNL